MKRTIKTPKWIVVSALFLGLLGVNFIGPLHAKEEKAPVVSMPSESESEQAPSGLSLESCGKKIGPFKVDDKSFTVVLKLKKIPGSTGSFSETVESFEIKDEKGASHFKRSFNIEITGNEFSDIFHVGAYVIEDMVEKGIILYYSVFPTAPSSGFSCQIFSLKGGRLVPLSPPLTVYGRIYDLPPGSTNSAVRLFEGNTMKFGIWTGWFEVIVPIRVLSGLKIAPLHYHLTYNFSAFDVKVVRTPSEEETFVRLFGSPSNSSIPLHVVIKEDTKVEFLLAYATISIKSEGSEGVISVNEDPWLKVRINDKEGFVRDAEDLLALGIRQAG